MKITYFALLLFTVTFSFAQKEQDAFNELVNSEMKSASNLMAVAVNPNTLNYDVTYHKLEFTINPAAYFVAGKVTTTYTALANMNSVTFDLVTQMVVTSVKKNNISLTFTQNASNELVITLPVTQAIGTSATVEIIYSGAPPSGGF